MVSAVVAVMSVQPTSAKRTGWQLSSAAITGEAETASAAVANPMVILFIDRSPLNWKVDSRRESSDNGHHAHWGVRLPAAIFID